MISTTSPSDPTVDVVNSSDKEQLKLSPTILAMIADFFKILSEVSRLQIVCSLKSETWIYLIGKLYSNITSKDKI